MTARWPHMLLGTLVTLAVVLAAAVFSAWPKWQSLPSDHALMRLSFTQSGVRSCRDRTEAELAALPRNMRQKQVCDRRRAPVYVELEIDGGIVFAEDLQPSGVSGTGPSRVYQRFELPAGTYDVVLRLRDDPAQETFTDTASRRITLSPGQSFAIDYDDGAGGFIFDKL